MWSCIARNRSSICDTSRTKLWGSWPSAVTAWASVSGRLPDGKCCRAGLLSLVTGLLHRIVQCVAEPCGTRIVVAIALGCLLGGGRQTAASVWQVHRRRGVALQLDGLLLSREQRHGSSQEAIHLGCVAIRGFHTVKDKGVLCAITLGCDAIY